VLLCTFINVRFLMCLEQETDGELIKLFLNKDDLDQLFRWNFYSSMSIGEKSKGVIYEI
jgi:hypothetical protein